MVWRTRSSGSRLIRRMDETPSRWNPSSPSTLSVTSMARTSSRVKIQILAPRALRDQHLLEPHGFQRPRPQALEIVADQFLDLRPDRGRRRGVAARTFLDHAL